MPNHNVSLETREYISPDGGSTTEPRRRWVEWSQAVLNGVVGDTVATHASDLSTPMSLVQGGEPVRLDAEAIEAAYPRAGARLCVFVHGLACTEDLWGYPKEPEISYGTQLYRDAGLLPLYVRYNTGLHISDNGAALAALLDRVTSLWRTEVRELVLVGHSMGGLVIRSACHVADEAGYAWVNRVTKAFYLGTPHLGAPLEKFGNALSYLLRTAPTPYTRLISDVINLRSSGIKDLRHANLRREDWDGHDQDELLENRRNPVPLLPHISHYLAVGTLTSDERDLVSSLFGDALVRLPSAAGQSDPDGKSPTFPQENVRVFPGLAHMTLAYHPDVYAQVRDWYGPGEPALEGEYPPAAPLRGRASTVARLRGLTELVQHAVEGTTTAVQRIHTEIASKPFDVLEELGPVAAPAQTVRVVHDSVVSGVYASIRLVNRIAGAAIGIALEVAKPKLEAPAEEPKTDAD